MAGRPEIDATSKVAHDGSLGEGVYLGTGCAKTSTCDRFADPAMPCPPPGASVARPTSSTRRRFGLTTSVSTTTRSGSRPYQRMLLNATSTVRYSPCVLIG